MRCLEQAIAYFTESGKLSMAARHNKEIAEMYESGGEKENALEYYGRAAELYEVCLCGCFWVLCCVVLRAAPPARTRRPCVRRERPPTLRPRRSLTAR